MVDTGGSLLAAGPGDDEAVPVSSFRVQPLHWLSTIIKGAVRRAGGACIYAVISVYELSASGYPRLALLPFLLPAAQFILHQVRSQKISLEWSCSSYYDTRSTSVYSTQFVYSHVCHKRKKVHGHDTLPDCLGVSHQRPAGAVLPDQPHPSGNVVREKNKQTNKSRH